MENSSQEEVKIAVLGGGCFWCTEAIFKSLRGVKSVAPGYTGGAASDANYDEVSTGRTGHVESIKIEYNPTVISYGDLLAVFFNTHDPTTLNRQGSDVGTQYRSAIFYTDESQRDEATKLISELNDAKAYASPVVTEVVPLVELYPAEDYHKNYYQNHSADPYCQIVIAPKLDKLQKRFAALLK